MGAYNGGGLFSFCVDRFSVLYVACLFCSVLQRVPLAISGHDVAGFAPGRKGMDLFSSVG